MGKGMKELSGMIDVFYILLRVWVIKVFLKTSVRFVHSTVHKVCLKRKKRY